MTPEESAIFNTWQGVVVTVASAGFLIGLVFVSFSCMWCIKKIKSRPAGEQFLHRILRIQPTRKQFLMGIKDTVVWKKMDSWATKKDVGGGKYMKKFHNIVHTVKESSGYDNPDQEAPVEGTDYNLGKLQYSALYDNQHMEFTLKIIKAQSLPARDYSGASDPYVKIMILPDRGKTIRTKIRNQKLNPVWNESFLFKNWPLKKLMDRTLYLQIIDHDRFSRDDPIGECYIPINEINLNSHDPVWKYIQPCKDSRGNIGEVLVSLCYQPKISRLIITIIKAREVKKKDISNASDVYVKIWLMFGTRRVEKRKTQVKKDSLHPMFNESFTFKIPSPKMKDTSLELYVMDHDRFTRNDCIGKVVLGTHSSPPEVRHWNDMVFHPRQQVERWHALREYS